MSEGGLSIKKALPIIVIAWVLSLVTTLVVAYFVPFMPIGTHQIGDGAIITTKLADGNVTSAKILDGTIVATDLATGTVVTVKVADGAITAAKIADGAVTSEKVAESAIVTVNLVNDTVTSAKIADSNVTTSDLADDAVTTTKIVDDAIVTVKLADGSVTSAKIVDATITAADIKNGEITTTKIANGAVTTSKIADYAVTSLKLAAYAIPFNTTYVTSGLSTTSTPYVDMLYTSVTLNVERNSTLIIMFSTEAYATAGNRISLTAAVNGTSANPSGIFFTPTDATTYGSYSYTFLYPGATSGFYTIQMQWAVSGGTGFVYYRTLTVIALPA